MKRMLSAVFALLLCLVVTACETAAPADGESPKPPPPSAPAEPAEPAELVETGPVSVEPPELDSAWEAPGAARLSLLQESYPAGVERLTLVVENTGEEELGYGMAFSCEKYTDGGWQDVTAGKELSFPAVRIRMQPHSVGTMDVHLDYLPAPLEEGLYRLTGGPLSLGEGGGETEPWQLGFRVAAGAAPEPDYCLHIPGQPVSALTENLTVYFINTTGKDAMVVDIPHLERRNAEGTWEEVPYKNGAGFCGTPSVHPTGGQGWSENVLLLWGMLEEGQYRLHYQAGADFDTDGAAYGVFDVSAAEFIACGYPFAEE